MMKEIVAFAAVDEELIILRETILAGCPETSPLCLETVSPYWNDREILIVSDGLISKD